MLRDLAGVVHVVPNGAINTLSNMTLRWSAYVMDIGVAYKEDTDHVIAVVKEIAAEMMQEAPGIYAKYYNAQELRDLLAIYKLSTGRKSLQTMPIVLADVTALMLPCLDAFQRDLDACITAVMQKHGYKKN